MTLDELVQMMLKEMNLAKIKDGQDLPLLIRSDTTDYMVADFCIRIEDGRTIAIIEMGAQP